MKVLRIYLIGYLFVLLFSCSENIEIDPSKPYPEELAAKVSRGLVCFQRDAGANFLSWRLLPSDTDDCEFFIWRTLKTSKGGTPEFIGSTKQSFFLDKNIRQNNLYKYSISTSKANPEEFYEVIFRKDLNYDALLFDTGENYKQAHVVTGDLNGDGELEILINYSKMQQVDSYKDAWMKSDDTYKLAAFLRNGKRLWTIDLGWGIEAGLIYAPIVVWDIDADGKCEVILKTNKSDKPKNYSGEYLTVLNGENGKVLREVRWPDAASNDYNSNSRNYIAVAHLDGINPSIVVGRGTYFKQVICAYDNSLNKKWERFLGSDIEPRFGNKYLNKIWRLFSNDQSRGSHSLPIADVDGDGSEEIIWGEHCIGEDGEDLWMVEDRIPYVGHPDINSPMDIIPEKPGLETFYCREGWQNEEDNIGFLVVDKEGKTIWANWGLTHVDGGWADKVVPNSEGLQLFAFDVKKKSWVPGKLTRSEPVQYLFTSKGEKILAPDSSWVKSFPADWEGDGIKEIITKQGDVKRYNNEVILSFSKGMLWGGDLFGDHREELVYAPQDGKVYIIFNTQEMTSKREITKLADRRYRNDLSRTAMQINVIPTTSGFFSLQRVKTNTN